MTEAWREECSQPQFAGALTDGTPVMETESGRLVYDCDLESPDRCFIPVPEWEIPEAEL